MAGAVNQHVKHGTENWTQMSKPAQDEADKQEQLFKTVHKPSGSAQQTDPSAGCDSTIAGSMMEDVDGAATTSCHTDEGGQTAKTKSQDLDTSTVVNSKKFFYIEMAQRHCQMQLELEQRSMALSASLSEKRRKALEKAKKASE